MIIMFDNTLGNILLVINLYKHFSIKLLTEWKFDLNRYASK